MSISCSVVSYHNSPDQIADVLRSISATPGIALTLVDNSRDDSLAAVAQQYGARYIHRPDNPGFGAAHNIAIREAIAAESTYHMVVNPDVSFGPEVIPGLLAYMEAHPDTGLVMPDIRYPDGRRQHLCKLLPHPGDLLVRRFVPALYRLSGRLDTYEMRRSGYDRTMQVPALSGCFMFLRTSVLKKTGGFDERYFMYLEDVDLSRRVGRVARTVYYPAVSITHAYQKGSYKSSILLTRHIRSAVRYFNKWGWFIDPERAAVNRAALRALEGARQAVDHAPVADGK
ncbi:glycosyltransferase family 2 protein [Noviherbaspirillum sp.]|uniref:glycosyltransferase family 2 protein n=1 Tax=Noviherbaspirillum sp. TaxID=1926288 RepID=UPI002D23FEEC|nr:glycosyltransferase family 2 protein [Noviherbaspirillum sp.]HZW20132.1 glycosyltransferase family 2 protein [Noviherbaspirillum sp.]